MSFRRKGRKDVLYTSDFNDIVAAIETLQAGGGDGGSATWGAITGTLSSQSDLQAELDGKANNAGLSETIRDTMGTALEAPSGSGMTIVPDDAVDKIRLYARTPPYKELMPLSGTRDFGPATHGLGAVYNSVTSLVASVLYFVPIYFEGGETITRVSINVQVAGAAGAAIRTGLFTGSAASGSTPAGRSLQTLVADWGTQAATTTGTKNWTVSTAVTRGWYWFGIVGNDSAVTTHTISSPRGFEQPSVQGQPNNCHYKISHGAGPAAFAATETPFAGNNQHPAFTFRVS